MGNKRAVGPLAISQVNSKEKYSCGTYILSLYYEQEGISADVITTL